jgi:hypothetical protein
MPNNNNDKSCWRYFNRARVVIPVITGVIILLGIIYKIDCYNIATYGDTVFAKDTEVAEKASDKDLKKLKAALELEQSIRKASNKLDRYNREYRSNQRWIDAVRVKYPNKNDIPLEMFKDYKKAKKRNEKLVVKIEKWEKKLEDLEDKELE